MSIKSPYAGMDESQLTHAQTRVPDQLAQEIFNIRLGRWGAKTAVLAELFDIFAVHFKQVTPNAFTTDNERAARSLLLTLRRSASMWASCEAASRDERRGDSPVAGNPQGADRPYRDCEGGPETR